MARRPSKTLKKCTLLLGDERVPAEVTEKNVFAIHKLLSGERGYVLTHIETGKAVLRSYLKGKAVEALHDLELELTEEKVHAWHRALA